MARKRLRKADRCVALNERRVAQMNARIKELERSGLSANSLRDVLRFLEPMLAQAVAYRDLVKSQKRPRQTRVRVRPAIAQRSPLKSPAPTGSERSPAS
jgi:hypothetical protein